MENAQPEVVKPATEKKTTEKLPYEPPKATFVPLRLEERLLGCTKANAGIDYRCDSHTLKLS